VINEMKKKAGMQSGMRSKCKGERAFSSLLYRIAVNMGQDKKEEDKTKICRGCGTDKSLSQYHRGNGKYGGCHKCKECIKSERRVDNPQKKINKVTDNDVLKIRALDRLRVSRAEIAEQIGVTKGYVGAVCSYKVRDNLEPTREFVEKIRTEYFD
jgi:hypothetical protein